MESDASEIRSAWRDAAEVPFLDPAAWRVDAYGHLISFEAFENCNCTFAWRLGDHGRAIALELRDTQVEKEKAKSK